MNYNKHYNNLITSRKERILNPNIYYENHHIIMRSMGGTDDLDNVIYLTAREHFIAHRLLWLIHRNRQTAFAFKMMCSKNKNWSSKIYEQIKQNLKHTDLTKIKIGNANKISQLGNTNKLGKKCSDITKQKMSLSHLGNPGPIFSDDLKLKISQRFKGKKLSEKHKEKIRQSKLGNIPWNKGKTHIVPTNKKPVYQCDLSGNIIKEWSSIIDIHKKLGYSKSGISSCCSGRYKSSHGFIWKYKKINYGRHKK